VGVSPNNRIHESYRHQEHFLYHDRYCVVFSRAQMQSLQDVRGYSQEAARAQELRLAGVLGGPALISSQLIFAFTSLKFDADELTPSILRSWQL
jgi:hypothetical protein